MATIGSTQDFMLIASAQEWDVVLRSFCENKLGSDADSITKYLDCINRVDDGKLLSLIKDSYVTLNRYGLTMRPWTDWESNKAPKWWTANNKVKHKRAENFQQASLINSMNAISGLYILLIISEAFHVQSGQISWASAYKTLRPNPSLFNGINT